MPSIAWWTPSPFRRHPKAQSGHEFAPHQSGAQMLEQPEREDKVHPDARGEAPQPLLVRPCLVQHRVHQLGWDDLG